MVSTIKYKLPIPWASACNLSGGGIMQINTVKYMKKNDVLFENYKIRQNYLLFIR